MLLNSNNGYIVTKLNFKIDINELKECYKTLQIDYKNQHRTWDKNYIHLDSDAKQVCASPENTIFHGWPLQSNMKDPKIMPSILKSKHPQVPWYNTCLMFGVMQKLYEKMPFAYRWTLFVLPPGGKIARHVDKNQYVILIPIEWGKEAVFNFDDTSYTFDANGDAYLLDVEVPHDTANFSNKDRVNLNARIDRDQLENIMGITGDI